MLEGPAVMEVSGQSESRGPALRCCFVVVGSTDIWFNGQSGNPDFCSWLCPEFAVWYQLCNRQSLCLHFPSIKQRVLSEFIHPTSKGGSFQSRLCPKVFQKGLVVDTWRQHFHSMRLQIQLQGIGFTTANHPSTGAGRSALGGCTRGEVLKPWFGSQCQSTGNCVLRAESRIAVKGAE